MFDKKSFEQQLGLLWAEYPIKSIFCPIKNREILTGGLKVAGIGPGNFRNLISKDLLRECLLLGFTIHAHTALHSTTYKMRPNGLIECLSVEYHCG